MTLSTANELSQQAWHTLETNQALAKLQTTALGLTSSEAAQRLAHFGPNTIQTGEGIKPWAIILHQFTSPLIYILLVVMVITLILQEWADSIVVAAVVLLNAIIGFTQEFRAENSMQALMRMTAAKTSVLRDGQQAEVDARNLAPGDIVFLESGDIVPADLRLLECTHLEVEEALLTGESLPVAKTPDALATSGTIPLGDRRNMAFLGTAVTSGRGIGLVVSTGLNTQMGIIAGEMRGTQRAQTPLQTRMVQFGRWISVAVLGSSALAFAIGIYLGFPATDMFFVAVAIAVAAIPEGLPIAMTVALAVGVNRMAKRNAIIRRLVAVEPLGSCNVIVTDKTGTLTENQMTVQSVWTGGREYEVTGPGRSLEGRILDGDSPVLVEPASPIYLTLLAGLLANESSLRPVGDSFVAFGDPTEVALLVAAAKAGLDRDDLAARYPRTDLIPFEPFRQFSATIHRHGDDRLALVKGAPERVAQMCQWVLTPDGLAPLDPAAVQQAAEGMAHRGLRVLGLALGNTPEAVESTRAESPRGLVFLGLQGMLDPPRAAVIPAIAACRRAGIRVVMATGDHPTTAAAIAEMVGLSDGRPQVYTGPQLEAMSQEEFEAAARTVSVFSRVSPSQKLRLVTTLREQGNIVAVTGDGVNDAPALKAAHIGAAMGRSGTDVAREASDMVLADDNFATVYAAVEEGRTAYANIRNVTFFLVSAGAGQIMAILASLVLGLPLPLVPVQILWMNMVTSGIQDKALAFEPGESHLYSRPPRNPREGIIPRIMLERIALVGLVMAAGALYMFNLELERGATLAYAQVTALTTLVMFQVFHVGNARSDELSVFQKNPLANPVLFYGTGIAVAVHIGAMYFPGTQFLLGLEPLSLDTWVRVTLVALSVIVVVELHKLVRRPQRGTARG
jgi:cation-transporting P-type ATPase F